MITIEMLKTYKKYLTFVQEKHFNKHFEAQKEYIHCKEGCAECCTKGEYPVSELEMAYLMAGFHALDKETQDIIANKIDQLVKERKETGNRFYECPFLINNRCSVYENRPIICRSHGLLFYVLQNGVNRNKIPACSKIGLNYSEVYDEEKQIICPEKWKKSGIKTEPVAYNISREVLISNNATKDLNLDFGESKALIDWFM